MKKHTITIISIISIIVVSLMLLGLTYGFFYTQGTGDDSKSVEVAVGDAKILFTDLSQDNSEDPIAPGYVQIKKFTVENIGESEARYYIYLTDVVNEFNRKSDITYSLYRKTGTVSYTINEDTDFSSWEELKANITYPSNSTLIQSNESISKTGDIYTYVLKVNYLNHPTQSQNEDQGKVFSGKITIKGDTGTSNPYTEGTLAYKILDNAKGSGSTSYREEPLSIPGQGTSTKQTYTTEAELTSDNFAWPDYNNYFVYSEEIEFNESTGFTMINPEIDTLAKILDDETKKAKFKYVRNITGSTTNAMAKTSNMWDVYKINSAIKSGSETSKFYYFTYQLLKIASTNETIESTLSQTKDDYGTSYYFRGSVKDNYLNYNGMCWRIVRILGDGSVKLVLESSASECNASTSSFKNAFIGQGLYGYDLDSANKTLSVNYLEPSYYPEKSMRNILNNWFSNNNFNTNDLKKGDWCLGNTTDAYDINPPYNKLTDSASTLIQSKTKFNYDSYTRLQRLYPETPTLECLNASKAEDDYIGVLTIDEVVFAGLKNGFTSPKSYLVDYNFALTNNLWLTLTPSVYTYIKGSDRYENQIFIVTQAYMSTLEARQDTSGNAIDNIRPSIVLNNTKLYTSGDGTQTNPYKVN